MALCKDRRSSLITEFAVVGPIFFILLFFCFDTAYTLFLQGVLDTALQATARSIQVGTTAAEASTTGQLMVSNLLCPNTLGLINCNSLYIRVERLNETTCPGGTQDIWNDTNGTLPVYTGSQGTTLGLSLYSSQNAATGSGTTPTGANPGPGACDSNTGFCYPLGSASSSGSEFIILSAVYVTPSFLGGLAPQRLYYNGNIVRAVFSQAAFITEDYTSTVPSMVTGC